MPFLRRLLFMAAREVASNPETRARAAEVVRNEVKPRAEAALSRAKPTLDAARKELREIAAETDPRRQPRAFASKLARRLGARARRR